MDEVARAALQANMSETAYLQELADLFLYLTDDLDNNQYDDAKKMARDILKGGASTDRPENLVFYSDVHNFFSEYPQVSTVIGFTLIQLKNTLLGDGVVKSAVNKMIEQSAAGEDSTTKSKFLKQSEAQRESKLFKCLNDIRNEITSCQAFVVTKMEAIFLDKHAGRNQYFTKLSSSHFWSRSSNDLRISLRATLRILESIKTSKKRLVNCQQLLNKSCKSCKNC